MAKTLNGIGYVRVSTSPQLKNYSPDQQERMITDYAASNGIKLIGKPILDAKSGRTLDRAGLTQVRELAASKRVQAVIVAFVDRLARNVEYVNTLRRQFAETGVELHIVSIGRVTDSPEAGLMMNITGSMAQFEVEQFARRSKMGKQGKARSGRYVGNGVPTYGYRKVGLKGESKPVMVPELIAIVHRIFDAYTIERVGIRSISNALNNDKVPAPGGGVWWWSTVKRLLSCRAYLGEFQYDGILIPLPELAVISQEQFDLAQRLKTENKEFSKRNSKHDYTLSNRLLCQCGRKMFGESGDRYRCTSTNLPRLLRQCAYGKVWRSSLEPVLWQYLRSLLTDEELQAGAALAEQRASKHGKRSVTRLEEVEQGISRLKKKISTWMDEFGDDNTLADIAQEKMRAASTEIRQLELEREELQHTRRNITYDATARSAVLDNATAIRAMLDDPDDVVRDRALKALRVTVSLRSRKAGGRAIVVSSVFGQSKPLPIPHNPGK
jgi:DNA invertase Pin-like site-specific DNA recombinase